MKTMIEHAECLVPKVGTAEQRRQSDVDLRCKNPQLADEIAGMGSNYPDEFAIIDLDWNDEATGQTWGVQIPWPIAELPLLKDDTVGMPKQHNISGVETEDWIDYSFTLKASFAFGLLQTAGKIPQDAIMQTFGEDAPYDADEGQLD